ncbi:hypothetical protein E4K10_12540 [Streptomyces sp. T1317-0309]|nr:hypothetical protein E4K10_12540 [Streptomyces sp. T1317-0309]
MNAWLTDPEAAPSGGGESFAAVARRVAATRDALLAPPGRTVLLVSHVTPVKTLVRLALGAPPRRCSGWSFPRRRCPRWPTSRTAMRASAS